MEIYMIRKKPDGPRKTNRTANLINHSIKPRT
jgi:hypothetical protein